MAGVSSCGGALQVCPPLLCSVTQTVDCVVQPERGAVPGVPPPGPGLLLPGLRVPDLRARLRCRPAPPAGVRRSVPVLSTVN